MLLKKYPQHPQRADAAFALAVAEYDLGRFAASVEAFDKLRQDFPDRYSTSDARQRLADVLAALAEDAVRGRRVRGRRPNRAANPHRVSRKHGRPAGTVGPGPDSNFTIRILEAANASLDECLERCPEPSLRVEAVCCVPAMRHARGQFAEGLEDAQAVLAADPKRCDALHLRGLCELGLGQPGEAIKTFLQIVAADPPPPFVDRVLYDLAWAYQAADQPERASETFGQLADTHPESRLAAECHFRVGEARYAAGDYTAAAKRYFQAAEVATDPDLSERAIHKLAWCCFRRCQFGAAEEAFDRQIAMKHEKVEAAGGHVDPNAPLQSLAADALVMIAECRFQQGKYSPALDSFEAALKQPAARESLRAMACVHAAQAAAELKHWDRDLELADPRCTTFRAASGPRRAGANGESRWSSSAGSKRRSRC